MVTPPVLDEGAGGPAPVSEFEKPATGPAVQILRLVGAIVIPLLLMAVFFAAFRFWREPDSNKLVQVVLAVIVGVGGVWGLYWSLDWLITQLPDRVAASVRPFLFAGPAMVILGIYLVYPAVNTVILSLQDSNSDAFVGFDNFATVFTESIYLRSLLNSAVWVLVVPAVAVAIGLGFATLVDKLGRRAENVSKSLIFLPMAISFVGASIVWSFVYSFRPEGFGEQIGILNAIWQNIGDPIDWVRWEPWNNGFLMVILIWLQTGFAMVILSSAIKSVPDEHLEAARIDGANEWKVFWKIVIPSVSSTIVVVWTTVVITVWKLFDIVWVMTGGQFGTSVVAERMVREFFTNANNGVGAALAVVLFIAVIPVLIVNVRRFRAQEATR